MSSINQATLSPVASLDIDPCGCMFGVNNIPGEGPSLFQSVGETAQKISTTVKEMKKEINVMRIAMEKPECPRKAKILTAAAITYLLCPIDLIPDCIPVLGYLDDIVIVGSLLWAARKSIPNELWEKCQAEAKDMSKPKKTDWKALPVFAGLWIGSAVYTYKIGKKLLLALL